MLNIRDILSIFVKVGSLYKIRCRVQQQQQRLGCCERRTTAALLDIRTCSFVYYCEILCALNARVHMAGPWTTAVSTVLIIFIYIYIFLPFLFFKNIIYACSNSSSVFNCDSTSLGNKLLSTFICGLQAAHGRGWIMRIYSKYYIL